MLKSLELSPVQTAIAQFQVDYYQCLKADGTLSTSLPEFADEQTLLQLYRTMLLTRLFDQKAIALQRTGRLGTYPSSYGQEAIAVAIGSALHTDDVFCPYYREFGAHLQRGVKMEEIFLFWGGDERGSNFAECPEDMPHCIPIASQCLHAVGVAQAMKYRRQKRCALVSIGEGGTSEGDFYEAVNVAGAWKLPVVFVINNNQWAISVSREAQTATETIAQKGIAGGLPSYQVDGNDVIASRAIIAMAVEKARAGEGACVIEAMTYRLGDHTTADDARRYRPQEELTKAEAQEPLRRLRHYLTHLGLWSEKQEQTLTKELQQQVEQAVKRYEDTQPQAVSSVFDSLYAELPEAYYEQREELLYYADKSSNKGAQ